MKYFVLTVDGMADRRMSACGGKSPMEVAAKPTMNMLSAGGRRRRPLRR